MMVTDIYEAMRERRLVRGKLDFYENWLGVHKTYVHAVDGKIGFKALFRLHGRLVETAHPDLAIRVLGRIMERGNRL